MTTKHVIALLGISVSLWGCSNFLDEKNQTDLTIDLVYSSPENIGLAVNALYNIQRDLANYGNAEHSLPANSLLAGDDLTFVRAGESSGEWAGTSWYDPAKLNSANKDVEGYWNYNYKIIGKANEIIFYALQMDPNNALVQQALGEAYCFRAFAYFNLLRRFDNIYFTTQPVNAYNVNDPVNYQPAAQAVVMAQIKADLDYAIDHLAWTTPQLGRFTKGFACHVKAQADMWPINNDMSTMDLDDAQVQVENILNSGTYSLMAEPKDVFTPTLTSSTSAKLNNSEAIYVMQWSNDIGGAPLSSAGSLSGHRFASATLTRYDKSTVLNLANVNASAVLVDMEQGGVSWGRVYPNDYLLSLYDKANDKRYTQYYRHSFTFNNITPGQPLVRKLTIQPWDIKYLFINGQPNPNMGLSAAMLQQLQTYGPNGAVGKTLTFNFNNGDEVPKFMASNFAYSLHPSTTKYFDKWTRDITVNYSYKDIMVFRLAETYLLGAEAYLRAGNSSRALQLFNAVYTRAGNTAKSALTLQDILDEDARELGLEGFSHRWFTLKRFGASVMSDQIKKYGGCLYNANINGYVYKTPMDFYSFLNRINYVDSNGKTEITTNITTASRYDDIRDNFDVNTHIRWPIPMTQINAMGGNYPQNPGYN